ncbi:hypothetical protein CWO28_22105 [Vibrio splendidus]|nr:hypothetical protein CWO28_22105 [Vibrio splendidus]
MADAPNRDFNLWVINMIKRYALFSNKNYPLHCCIVALTVGFSFGVMGFILSTERLELFIMLIIPMFAFILFAKSSHYRIKHIDMHLFF